LIRILSIPIVTGSINVKTPDGLYEYVAGVSAFADIKYSVGERKHLVLTLFHGYF
jgi:hypothetical protein